MNFNRINQENFLITLGKEPYLELVIQEMFNEIGCQSSNNNEGEMDYLLSLDQLQRYFEFLRGLIKTDFTNNLLLYIHKQFELCQTARRTYGKDVHRKIMTTIIDLETLGLNTFEGSPVAQISTASFGYNEVGELICYAGDVKINTATDGYIADEGTLNWWKSLDPLLFNNVINNLSSLNLNQGIALILLTLTQDLIVLDKYDLVVYGNSNTFDIEMLNNHVRRTIDPKMQLFKHYKDRDARPLLSLNLANREDCKKYAYDKLERLGINQELRIEHNALFDVLFEGKQLIDTLELICEKC